MKNNLFHVPTHYVYPLFNIHTYINEYYSLSLIYLLNYHLLSPTTVLDKCFYLNYKNSHLSTILMYTSLKYKFDSFRPKNNSLNIQIKINQIIIEIINRYVKYLKRELFIIWYFIQKLLIVIYYQNFLSH